MNQEPHFDLVALARRACRDLENVFPQVDPAQMELLAGEIVAARRIVCYGAGREGLMMQAIAMRLMHAGFQSYVVGEMVTPRVGQGRPLFSKRWSRTFPDNRDLTQGSSRSRWPDDPCYRATRAGFANACRHHDSSACSDDGGRSCRSKHPYHGHPLRSCLVVVWRSPRSTPSRTDSPEARGHVHPLHQHEMNSFPRLHQTHHHPIT